MTTSNEDITYDDLQRLITQGGNAIRNLKYAQDKAEQYRDEVKSLMAKHEEKSRRLMESIQSRNSIIHDLWIGKKDDYQECQTCQG
jgi:ubiquitin C-terminal hydrolase